MPVSRRMALRGLGLPGLTALRGALAEAGRDTTLRVAGRPIEVTVSPVGADIVRISLVSVEGNRAQSIPSDGSLVRTDWGPPVVRLRSLAETRTVSCGEANWSLPARPEPLSIRVEAADRRLIQRIGVDGETGSFGFHLGDGPVLGLGEGGPQFDRRGSVDRMRNGQGGYRLRTHG